VIQGGSASTQVRFQPRIGQLLAAASDSVVSIIDFESDRPTLSLKVKKHEVNFKKND